jgi:hypothetical protein
MDDDEDLLCVSFTCASRGRHLLSKILCFLCVDAFLEVNWL